MWGVERLHVAESLRSKIRPATAGRQWRTLGWKARFGETRLRAPPLLFPQRNAQNTPDHLCCGHDQLGVLSWRVETLSESCIFSILAGLYRGAIVQTSAGRPVGGPSGRILRRMTLRFPSNIKSS